MGVIRGARDFRDPISDAEAEQECPLSDMIESADESRIALDLSELEESANRRRLRRQRRAELANRISSGPNYAVATLCGDVEGLSSRRVAHKGQRKQRRIQNDKQLRSLCQSDDDLNEISIYDFVENSISAFALILQEKDNIALWNAMLTAEADEDDACDDDFDFGKKNPKKRAREPREKHPAALTPEDCYRRLDSDMRRTLRRQRCPTDMIRNIEDQLESFFTNSSDGVYRVRIENSYARLMLHAVCEYMGLQSKSMDHSGCRWTLVKNPHSKFIKPPVALSVYLESRRNTSGMTKNHSHLHPHIGHHFHPHKLGGKFRH